MESEWQKLEIISLVSLLLLFLLRFFKFLKLIDLKISRELLYYLFVSLNYGLISFNYYK